MPEKGGQSETYDPKLLQFEHRALRIAVALSVLVLAVVGIVDFSVWATYGLPLANSTLVAQGTFALPVVAGVAALGAGYGFFRTRYPGINLFEPLPVEAISQSSKVVSGAFRASVSVTAGAPRTEAVTEDTTVTTDRL